MKTILTIAAILTAVALIGIFSTSAFAYDGGDESETNTQQVLKQKNVGSGESTNFNCGELNRRWFDRRTTLWNVRPWPFRYTIAKRGIVVVGSKKSI